MLTVIHPWLPRELEGKKAISFKFDADGTFTITPSIGDIKLTWKVYSNRKIEMNLTGTIFGVVRKTSHLWFTHIMGIILNAS